MPMFLMNQFLLQKAWILKNIFVPPRPPKKLQKYFRVPLPNYIQHVFVPPQPEKIVPPPCPDKEWTTPELLKATIKEVLPRFHTRE